MKARYDEALVGRLVALTQQGHLCRADAVVGVFAAMRAEPELGAFYRHCWRVGLRLALPRVVGKSLPLQFGLYEANTSLRAAGFGTRIPEPFESVEPDLLVIPCVAFHAERYRLGYGGGFYDRTLAERGVRTIGVAYDECEWPQYVAQPHDRRLDFIVTPTRLLSA